MLRPAPVLTAVLTAAAMSTAVPLAGTASASPAPAPSAAAVPLVFSSDRDGDSELYRVDSRGRSTQLTRNTSNDANPVWSPDGTRIAFVSDRDGDDELYVMRADGSRVRQLTHNRRTPDGGPAVDQYPAWSPGGTRLAFASNRTGGETEIWVVQADGSRPTRLTRTARHVMDHTPSWSPDGRLIAFASNRLAYDDVDLYLMRPDGTGVRRLTSAPGDENAPDWSPDGRRIAFSSNRQQQQDVYVMDADGRGTRKVTGRSDLDEVFPRWTARGDRLVFSTFRSPTGRAGDLHVVDLDGSGRRLLTWSRSDDTSPDPHPRGS